MADSPSPTSLVALRDRREAAIQQLSDSFAADVLSLDDFDDRIARAHSATGVAELDALVADLPAASTSKSTALVPLAVDASLQANATKKRLRAIFGNLERHGAWIVPDQLAVTTTFGSAVIDFREARFAARAVTLDARVFCGNLEIIVPPQLAVECDGSSIFGNIESHGGSAVADPDRPLLRISGTVYFGNIEVHTRLPGESERDARKRKRREKKALATTRRHALPAHSDDK
ncbi:MAG TPA: LiaF domain-containing protein [Polyangia bacterium]|jgi:hypothetical protein